MTATPRTDAVVFRVHYAEYVGDCVKADFARQLEREIMARFDESWIEPVTHVPVKPGVIIELEKELGDEV